MTRNSWANLALLVGAVCIVARIYTLERAYSERSERVKVNAPKWGIIVGEA